MTKVYKDRKIRGFQGLGVVERREEGMTIKGQHVEDLTGNGMVPVAMAVTQTTHVIKWHETYTHTQYQCQVLAFDIILQHKI